ncbi:MAG TPA: TolC family protein [Chitinophagaceae bacterium]|nr:TolC family protein [Chitinophagaceae bacterium]
MKYTRRKQLNRRVGLIAGMILFVSAAMAQQPVVYLTLKEATDSTLANNRDLGLSRLDEKIAKAKTKEMDAIYLPQADFSFTALSSNNPLNAFGFKLQQQVVQQKDFNPDLLNKPGASGDYSGRLQVKQPLLNMDLVYMRKAVAAQEGIYQMKTQRTSEYLTYEVKKGYLQLQLLYEAEKVLKEALSSANAMYTFTDNRVKEGLMQKSDALNVQVWIHTVETNLAETASNIRNASDYLSLLMGRPYGTVYSAEPAKPENTELSGASVPENRADFAAMKIAMEASSLMIKSAEKSYLPRINAFASYQVNDYRLTGFGAGSYLAGLQLSWDIFKGNSTKNKINTQQVELSKLSGQLENQQVQSQLELNKTLRQLEDARFKIRQQTAAVENATEALRILQDRYEQGLVNSTDVLQAQTQLSQQQLGKAQAVFSYNSTAAYISFLTSSQKN